MEKLEKVSTTKIEMDPALIERARSLGTSVVVLPVRSVDGRAVYTESSVLVLKRLKAAGIDAGFLDPAEQRVFEVKKNALEAALAAYALGIASAASWDALKALFRSKDSGKLSITYVDLDDQTGTRAEAWRVEGNADDVLDAIDRLRQQPHKTDS